MPYSRSSGEVDETAVSGDGDYVPTARPVCNLKYKVYDDLEQTYISREEARDGSALSGSYSYVDAEGSLVTVNYEAGPEGYKETREKKQGFVNIREKPVKTQFKTASRSAKGPSGQSFVGNQNDIVSQILSSLQPLISKTVEGVISRSS